MSKDAESRLLHETPDRKPEFAKMKPPVSAWITGLATIVALIACMGFSILFQKALSGFSKQVNAFVSIGDFSSNFLQAIVFIITAAVILYLLFIYLASARVFSNVLAYCGSPCLLFMSSFGSQGFLILWVLMLCFVSSVSLVYFLFIGGIYSFCALVDQQCFDFKVLIPAIVSRFSNKKVDMTFCAEKKELLCSQQNNQIWNFFGAFICCIATFAAVLFIQNCVVYGLGKRQAAKEHKKREHYEMKSMNS
uniref:MARVEL domain-containing protein n=1 Tax=Haemonchus contortus TaxID=6289 RepID=A0A7I4Z726_HAECO